MADTPGDAAQGAILGALCGDAAGARLEFLGHHPTAAEVAEAMAMSGGGCWGVAPGQITDDGELALCLLQALHEADGFDVEVVARWYHRWYDTGPFDIGATTTNGLSAGPDAAAMTAVAARLNAASKANGGLMRISPLAAWGARMSEDALVSAVAADHALTHPNPTCRDASAAYGLAVRHLVREPGDAEGALQAAWAHAKHGEPEVTDWLRAAERGEDLGYTPHDGFVKYGFGHAFRHLVQQTPYRAAIEETVAGGGDTDTNACIVGGLLGALHGRTGLPGAMVAAVLECDPDQGRPRPDFLHAGPVLSRLLPRLG